MRSISLLLTGWVLCSVPTYAQGVEIDIWNLIEYRSSVPYYSHLLLKGTISGIRPEEGRMIRMSDTYALDEQGDTLQLTRNEWRFYSYFPDCQLALDLPSRKSRTIPRLRGKIQVLTPSEEKGSIVHLTGFTSRKGLNLLADQENSLQLILLDSVDFPAFAATYNELFPQYLRQQEPNLSESALAVNLETMEMIMGTGNGIAQSEYKLYLAIEDPESRIIKITIQDEEGNSRDRIGADFRIPMHEQLAGPLGLGQQQLQHLRLACFQLDAATGENWTIKLIIANDASLEEYQFAINDIILP